MGLSSCRCLFAPSSWPAAHGLSGFLGSCRSWSGAEGKIEVGAVLKGRADLGSNGRLLFAAFDFLYLNFPSDGMRSSYEFSWLQTKKREFTLYWISTTDQHFEPFWMTPLTFLLWYVDNAGLLMNNRASQDRDDYPNNANGWTSPWLEQNKVTHFSKMLCHRD